MNATTTRVEVLEALRTALGEHPEVLFAYLYGSLARDAVHARSDVDVGVYLDPAAMDSSGKADGRLALLGVLTSSIQAALPARQELDVVILQDAPPLLSERILRHGTLILSRDEPERLRWIVWTKNRYCDLTRVRRLLDETVERRILDGRFGR